MSIIRDTGVRADVKEVRKEAICGGKNSWQKNSKCKGPGAEACQEGFRNGKVTRSV